MKNPKVSKHIIPSYWVIALFYADYEGLNKEECEQLTNWLSKNDPGSIVEVSENDEYPMLFEGLLHMVTECTFFKS